MQTMKTYYTTTKMKHQRFIRTGWAKTIIRFMLENHINDQNHRCNLNFHPKSSHTLYNELVSFHKEVLLITVEQFFYQEQRASRCKK